jgi:ADP-ribosylglycohydrolase
MLGAIAGDIIGSPYEACNLKSTRFPLFSPESVFTDDSVLTAAVADVLLNDGDYVEAYHDYFHRYPSSGFGVHFIAWAYRREREPYNSWGNGSAMRVSPVGFAAESLEEALAEAKRSAEVTHNHPEGVKGAQAVASSIFLARTGSTQPEIRDYVRTFGYTLDFSLDDLRPRYRFDVSCQGSVPVAITAFLESTGWENAVRLAVSMGGDSDTIACMTGGIAQAFYGLPEAIAEEALRRLDAPLAEVAVEFARHYDCEPVRA